LILEEGLYEATKLDGGELIKSQTLPEIVLTFEQILAVGRS